MTGASHDCELALFCKLRKHKALTYVPMALCRDSNQARRRRLMAGWAAGKPPSIVTRHIFLIRHGHYHEHNKEDHEQTLTPLGQRQAKKTGERIAKIIQHNNSQSRHQSSPVKLFAVSDLTRAKQTADIIHKELETMHDEHDAEHPNEPWVCLCRSEPDPLLNEGFPGTLRNFFSIRRSRG